MKVEWKQEGSGIVVEVSGHFDGACRVSQLESDTRKLCWKAQSPDGRNYWQCILESLQARLASPTPPFNLYPKTSSGNDSKCSFAEGSIDMQCICRKELR